MMGLMTVSDGQQVTVVVCNDRHEASAPQWQSKDCTMTTVQGMDTCTFVLEKWGTQMGKNEAHEWGKMNGLLVGCGQMHTHPRC